MLINKAALSSSCQVIICDEHYTSKICGSCGELHHNLGKNKTFICPHCHYEADRDINAARNILLHFLTLNIIMLKRGSLGEASVSYAPTASHSVPIRENGVSSKVVPLIISGSTKFGKFANLAIKNYPKHI